MSNLATALALAQSLRGTSTPADDWYPDGAGVLNVGLHVSGDDITGYVNSVLDLGGAAIFKIPNGVWYFTGFDRKFRNRIQFLCESRDAVVVLPSGSPGFGNAASPKPWLGFGSDPGAVVDENGFMNRIVGGTWRIEDGNPGAIAVRWYGNNLASLMDARFESEGTRPVAAIRTGGACMASGFFRLEIDGFGRAFDLDNNRDQEMAIIDCEVRNCGQALRTGRGSSPSIIGADWECDGAGPAVDIALRKGMAYMVDSRIAYSGAGSAPSHAIEVFRGAGGVAMFRGTRVEAEGYGSGVKSETGAMLHAGLSISEFSTDTYLGRAVSAEIPREAPPDTALPQESQWAYVPLELSGDDPTARVQAACDATTTQARGLYFGSSGAGGKAQLIKATMSGTVTVPRTVLAIRAFCRQMEWTGPDGRLVVADGDESDPPLLIEGWEFQGIVEHSCSRRIVFRHCVMFRYDQLSDTVAYVEDSVIGNVNLLGGGTLHGDQADLEAPYYGKIGDRSHPRITVGSGSKLRLACCKSENNPDPMFLVQNGGEADIRGHYHHTFQGATNPISIVESGGKLTLGFGTNESVTPAPILVIENGANIAREAFPVRPSSGRYCIRYSYP